MNRSEGMVVTKRNMKDFWGKPARLLVLMIFISYIAGLTGCSTPAPTTEELWESAMQDAVFSEDSEIMELVTLTPEDPHVIWDESGERVLLFTWHDYDDECEPGGPVPSGGGDIWATSLGEMTAWYEEHHEGVTDWELRFAQLLGVHADEGYTCFTGFWVSPEDVIRPAYLTDIKAQMEIGYDNLQEGPYKEWFDQNILWSYFESDYPWTRLGYTYDWSGGASEYGLTEFLISESSRTEIVFSCTTDEFVLWLESQLK